MQLTRSMACLATLIALGAAVPSPATAAVAPPTEVAVQEQAEHSTLQCASSAPIFRVTTAGDMYLYQHGEPESGVMSWSANPVNIGAGWQAGRSVAAPDGVIYAAWNDDALRRYRWNGAAWDTFVDGAQYEVVDTGWARYTTAEYKNRVTVDAEGHIYTIEPDGNLHWRAYDATTDTWTHRVLDSGWSQFDLIVAGGRGVIYARTPGGSLFRYRYHAASQRWLRYGQSGGVGWQMFDRMFTAGGDVLYGVRKDSGHVDELMWYRYDENTESWTPTTPTSLGVGWTDWTTSAAPDTCQRVGTGVPAVPAVPAQPHGPVTLLNTSDNHVHYSYVDTEGRAIHAEATDLTGASPVPVAAIPALTGATATTGTGEHANGRVQVVANGTDAQLRASTQTSTPGQWEPPTNLSGFIATPASVTRLADNTLNIFALDGDYGLWVRRQAGANGPMTAWLPIGGTPLAHNRLTLVPTANGTRVIGLGRDGQFHTATYENWTLSTWTSLGGTNFTGTASAVVMPNNTLQLFATDATGAVRTQRQTTTGFPGTWTTIPGITATGSPSAIMAPAGTLQIVVRSNDHVYYTGQSAPGTTTFTPWRTVTTTEETSTEPTALAVPSSNTWVVAYLNDVNAPKLRRYQQTTGPARVAEEPAFTDIPLRFQP